MSFQQANVWTQLHISFLSKDCLDCTHLAFLQQEVPTNACKTTYSHGCATRTKCKRTHHMHGHKNARAHRCTCAGMRAAKGTGLLQRTFRNIPGPHCGIPARTDEQAAAHLHQSAHCFRVAIEFSDAHACAVGCTAANCARHSATCAGVADVH